MGTPHEGCTRIAFVGGGPRGLSALEFLYSTLALAAPSLIVHSIVFEPNAHPGSGPNYAPDQFSGSLLNLPEREIDIPARNEISLGKEVIAGFPSYKEWAGVDDSEDEGRKADVYPPRARLGEYLQSRFNSLVVPLERSGRLTIIDSEVRQIRQDVSGGGYRIVHARGSIESVDEVVLAVGHQPTEPDETMQAWAQHAIENPACSLIMAPYPLEDFIHDSSRVDGATVALRGFGLSMIDVVKGLTEGRGGEFKVMDERLRSMEYKPSSLEPAKIVPFSLDGLPMAAKPLTHRIDERYIPDAQLQEHFRLKCSELAQYGEGEEAYSQLLQLVSDIQGTVYLEVCPSAATSYSRSRLSELAKSWLNDEQFRHECIVDRDLPTAQAMKMFADMACGVDSPSLDYCLGQVWRHLQTIMFHSFSHSSVGLEFMQDLIALHERMKRYAYGPPVDNVRSLLALLDAGILDLMVVDDPDIRMSQDGWHFSEGNEQIVASMLIDTVLSSPDIQAVSTPLVQQLLDDGYLIALGDGLGASTQTGAVANRRAGHDDSPSLALLGRLAKGSILGTDSISESFGGEQREWAIRLVARLSQATTVST